jgi:phosphatidylglycerophosphatase A
MSDLLSKARSADIEDVVAKGEEGFTAPIAPQRPSAAFMRRHPAHLVAFGFGAGLAPLAPGTVGSLWAWLVFTVIQGWLNPTQMGVLIAASFLLGCWASTVTTRHLGVADPGCIVWDEVVAVWLVLWLVTPAGFWAQAAAIALFRYFDAAKPGPVRWADQHFKGFGWRGGFGVMFDDVVAAFCTLVVVAVWRF